MKKRSGVKFWTKIDGELVGEEWISCREFAAEVGRPYRTVLRWIQRKWLPAVEVGGGKYVTCLTPRVRAMRVYRELRKSGPVRAPRRNSS